MTGNGEMGHRQKVDRATGLLVQAARIDPHLREAAVLVEQEIHALRRALYDAACSTDPAEGLVLDHEMGLADVSTNGGPDVQR